MRVLVVEDDETLAGFVSRGLENADVARRPAVARPDNSLDEHDRNNAFLMDTDLETEAGHRDRRQAGACLNRRFRARKRMDGEVGREELRCGPMAF